MREHHIEELGIVVTYPEYIAWLYDKNNINIRSVNGDTVGARLSFTQSGTSEYRYIEYVSEQTSLTFNIDDLLKSMSVDYIGDCTCSIDINVNGEYVRPPFCFDFRILEGKSFTHRSHYISKTFYIYSADELEKFEIASPSGCTASLNGYSYSVIEGITRLNLTQAIYTEGTYEMCLNEGECLPYVRIIGDEPVSPGTQKLFIEKGETGCDADEKKGGDIWSVKTIYPVCHRIVFEERCDDYNFIELKYRDTDGCVRYVGGKLNSETMSNEKEYYTRNEPQNIFRNIPNAHITGSSVTISASFNDIRRDAYLSDIMFCDNVYYRTYNNEWAKCVIENEKVTSKNDDEDDYTFDLIISKD